jgi:NADH-quinone oxidoreductase subunit N
MLLITAGVCLSAAANDLITLFLSLELISIPTYVMLYLPKADAPAQEAAIKYFLLSIFSSAMLLFGFSYLYGLSGTTNIPAIIESLDRSRNSGFSMVALVMILAGLGFKITAVPFHFYAPDVYQGTSTSGAAILSFVPKVAGFLVLIRLLGYVPQTSADVSLSVSDHVPVLLWIMAAVTMTLGNVLAFLQDNLKRMLAYSSVAHAGYMLIGLAVTPKLLMEKNTAFTGGVEAVVFYLVAYGAMTIGAFAVLGAISTRERPIDTLNDISGLGRSQPGLALMMTLFMFSLLGLPMTAGFYGKLLLFGSALNLWANGAALPQGASQAVQPAYLFMILAIIGVVNAAISGFYYLRVAGAMFLGEELKPIQKTAGGPVLASIVLCAFITLAGGIYPEPLRVVIHQAVPHPGSSAAMAGHGGRGGEQVVVEELAPVGP